MRIIRNNVPNIGPYVTLQTDRGNRLSMYYDNNDLCIENKDFLSCNIYDINKKNELYEPFHNMFTKLKQYDKFRHVSKTANEARFEWISDDVSMNRLVILEKHDCYWIVFLKNKNNLNESNNTCTVRFSLTNSNDIEIAKLFDEMFINSASYLLPYVIRKKYIKK